MWFYHSGSTIFRNPTFSPSSLPEAFWHLFFYLFRTFWAPKRRSKGDPKNDSKNDSIFEEIFGDLGSPWAPLGAPKIVTFPSRNAPGDPPEPEKVLGVTFE